MAVPQFNEKITNSNIMVLAGAGASAHLEYPIGSAYLGQLRENYSSDRARDKLFGTIVSDECRNFEYIYEYVDQAAELLSVVAPGGPLANNFGVREASTAEPDDVCALRRWLREGRTVGAVAKELREELYSTLIQVYGELRARDMIEASCWPLFLDLVHPGQGKVLPVFTTNYDLVFEDLRDRFIERKLTPEYGYQESFRGPRIVMPKLLDEVSPGPEARAVAFFRLHGCVAWESIPGGAKDGAYAQIRFDDDRPQAAPSKLAVVRPSLTKVPFEEPYWTAHMYLVECLRSAELVVFIGYGFADTSIVHLIKYAMLKNPVLKIAVMDPDTQALTIAQEAGLPAEKLQPIRHCFGEHTREMAEELLSRDPSVGAGLDAFKEFEKEVRAPKSLLVSRQLIRERVVNALAEHRGPVDLDDLALDVLETPGTVNNILRELMGEGVVEHFHPRKWALADTPHKPPPPPPF